MGKVYRARDPVLDRAVALKTVTPSLLARPESLTRFHREARAAARLQHPNIVTIYELGEVEGLPYIAMELLDGYDLAQVVAERERFSLGLRLRMVTAVCRALDYAHKKGVIHRDVKPANIRVLPDGSIKLVDFGIARLADSQMTQTGTVLGTPSYVAPEALLQGRVDHRADMWAVGVVLYELLTGERPFEADTIPGLVYKIAREPFPPLDADALGIPEAVTAVAERALQKQPGDRYQDLAEMAVGLELAAGLSGPVEPLLSPEQRARACRQSLDEARRLLNENDLERALEAARRAQALEPSRTGVITLVRALEERLEEAPTQVSAATVVEARAPREPLGTELTPPTPAPGAALVERLRQRGASIFRDLGAFGEQAPSQATSLSPRGDQLAVCGADGTIRIWELRSRTRRFLLRTELHRRTGHDARAINVAYAHDARLLASGHVDGSVHLWDMALGDEVPVKLRHEGIVGAVVFSPDGRLLASGGMDSTLKLWDVEAAVAGEARRLMVRQPSGVTALTFASDGSWLASGHANRVLRVIDSTTHRLIATLRGPEALVNLLALAPRNGLLAASQDRTIRLFDMGKRSQALVLEGLRRPATAVCCLEETVLAAASLENLVQMWDLQSGAVVATLWGAADESFAGVAVGLDGRQLAVTLADGRVRLFGLAD